MEEGTPYGQSGAYELVDPCRLCVDGCVSGGLKDFIEFQKWLITVLLIFGTASVILLAILLCVSPDYT